MRLHIRMKAYLGYLLAVATSIEIALQDLYPHQPLPSPSTSSTCDAGGVIDPAFVLGRATCLCGVSDGSRPGWACEHNPWCDPAIRKKRAQGLMCYTCNTPTASSECNEETNCSAMSSMFAVCKTITMSPDVGFPFTGNEIVVRQCAQTCIPTGQNWIGITKKVLCCNLDLCNRQGLNGTTTDNSSTDCKDSSDATVTVSFLITSVSVLAVITYTAL